MPSTDIGAASGNNLGSNLGSNQGGNLGGNQGGNLESNLGSSLEDLAYQTVGANGQAVAHVNGRLCTEGQLSEDQLEIIKRNHQSSSEAIRGPHLHLQRGGATMEGTPIRTCGEEGIAPW